MWKILGVALSLLFAILTSCENSTQTDPLDNSNLIPLEIGNKWEYEFTQYRFNPDDSLKTLFDSTTNVMEVVRIDTIDNFIGYIVDQIPIKFTFNAQLPIYYYKSRGLYTAEYPYWLTVPPSPAHEYLLLLHRYYIPPMLDKKIC